MNAVCGTACSSGEFPVDTFPYQWYSFVLGGRAQESRPTRMLNYVRMGRLFAFRNADRRNGIGNGRVSCCGVDIF